MSANWYGHNRSGRTTPFNVGDIVRYGDGPTALMRITSIRKMGGENIATAVRYYGSHFFGGLEGRYHGQCMPADEQDLKRWDRCHDGRQGPWIRGAWGTDA